MDMDTTCTRKLYVPGVGSQRGSATTYDAYQAPDLRGREPGGPDSDSINAGPHVPDPRRYSGDFDGGGQRRYRTVQLSVLGVQRDSLEHRPSLECVGHVVVGTACTPNYMFQVWVRSAGTWPQPTMRIEVPDLTRSVARPR